MQTGSRIEAIVRKYLAHKYERLLRVGSVYVIRNFTLAYNSGTLKVANHEYKVTWQSETTALLQSNALVPHTMYSFVDFAEVVSSVLDDTILVGKRTIQNGLHCCKLMFNPTFPAAVEFKEKMLKRQNSPSQGLGRILDTSQTTLEDDFLNFNERKTLAELKENGIYAATIKYLVDPKAWWYNVCTCNKVVQADGLSYYCGPCGRRVVNAKPRTPAGVTCPVEIMNLLGNKFPFKVFATKDSSGRFEPSYTVKRVTDDEDLMSQFSENENDSESSKTIAKDTINNIGTPVVDVDVSNEVPFTARKEKTVSGPQDCDDCVVAMSESPLTRENLMNTKWMPVAAAALKSLSSS
ncbi:hypothetical protein OROGR_030401 [Orobanche gracilis]